jgi:hypothetical protein
MRVLPSLVLVSSLLLALGGVTVAGGEEAPEPQAPEAEKPAPQLTLEAVSVAPSGAGARALAADTLCRLTVTLRNAGAQKASALGFRVRVNGQELPVYRNHLFYYLVEPGQSQEVPLYNFWTTETGRPFPPDAKLRVEVELVEAQWMRVEMEEGVEAWTPLGAVAGLPSARSLALDLARAKN